MNDVTSAVIRLNWFDRALQRLNKDSECQLLLQKAVILKLQIRRQRRFHNS